MRASIEATGSVGRSATEAATSAACSIVAAGVSLIHRDSQRSAHASNSLGLSRDQRQEAEGRREVDRVLLGDFGGEDDRVPQVAIQRPGKLDIRFPRPRSMCEHMFADTALAVTGSRP